MKVHFIQLSDIHFQYKDYNIMRMRDSLLEYLIELNKEDSIDFVVITGDIAHQAKGYTTDIIEFLDGVLKSTHLTIENMHIIPGNHDINRSKQMRNFVVDNIQGKEKVSSKLDGDIYTTLLEGQDEFFDFYSSYLQEQYPKEQLHFIKRYDKYNVFHINTCLASGKDHEEGHLLVDINKFYKVIRELKHTKEEKVLNIAIGHHTINCFCEEDREAIKTNFLDNHIDLYLAGHVHNPSYNISLNHGEEPFLELISSAIMEDEYAKPGFIEVEVNLEDGKSNIKYHIWNEHGAYWAIDNQVGRRVKNGILKHTIERLNKKKVPEVLKEWELPQDPPLEVDENEFKKFIIDLHENSGSQKHTGGSFEPEEDLENKFIKMVCSETFQIDFDSYSRFFDVIEQIMSSTSYVSSDKKELITGEISDKYMLIHQECKTGDEIFVKIAEQLTQEYAGYFSYSKLRVKRYIKILTSWVIYKCLIFNDDKREKVV
ncbi:metallophosphoesterase family protein [Bacillus cereus group sp. Bce033]|uniref:metallophosphoesterase family protein n=1 Tax=Bacillus TaxID=1386 RepID=UPI0009438296|nr:MULTISPECIES: metallophosphoesterase [Bacillus]KAB7634103.1 metallophosphoesterase [Bacillus sp. B4-WWTP-NA-D-NA-NA]MDA1509872.1 metallophosphoesterase [Bacillus cereus group sp. TH36-2LC]RRA98486.1 metallophosphoesterase [Bacillus pacificus]